MTTFFAVLITLNILCGTLLLLSGIQRQKRYYLTLALLNFLCAGFHWATWRYHQSIVLTDAVWFSRLHTAFVLVATPMLTYTFGSWCRFRYTNTVVQVLTVVCGGFLVFNALATYPIRFGTVQSLEQYVTWFGDKATILLGTQNQAFLLFHALFGLNSLLLLFFAFRFFRQQKSLLSFALVGCVLLQLLSGFIGYQIDNRQLAMVYVGGVPITLFSVVAALLVSMSLKRKTSQLSEQTRRRFELETTLAKLAEGISTPSNVRFYQHMVQTLYEFSKADFVMLGLIRADDSRVVDSLVVLHQGQVMDNFSYELAGTPCEKVTNSGTCMYPNSVAELFPKDTFLHEQQIQSYIGMPLLDENNQAMGVLVLLFRHDLLDESQLHQVLKVFAARAAAELKRDQLERKLKSMAYFDYLSTLPNRAKLLEVINQTLVECQKQHSNAMMLLLDLDHFGEINRKYGYEVGDQVIRQLGMRLANYASKEVFIARNSGDEFAVLLAHVPGEALSLLQVHWTALRAIISEPCLIGHRQLAVHCSLGAVLFPEQIANRFDVISSAEHALQQAKLKGRDQCSLFDPSMLAARDSKRELEHELKAAMEKSNQLYVVYQPKVNQQRQVCGAEALLRWQHPQRGAISPAEFIPVAEESGLIHELGRYVLRQVCEDLTLWRSAQLLMPAIAVNVSANEFEQPAYVDDILARVHAMQVPAQSLELELTETGLLKDARRAVQELSRLRDAGIRISLDDFGTGYSSLSYLQELPLDVLKIDKSFVDNLPAERSVELIRAIIAIAQQMKLTTVAEGTETAEQVEQLAQMGCDLFQGYYFSRPIRAEELVSFCQQHGVCQD